MAIPEVVHHPCPERQQDRMGSSEGDCPLQARLHAAAR